MYPVSTQFLRAIRYSNTMTARAMVYEAGSDTPLVTNWPGKDGILLPIVGGEVVVDSTSDVRRKLTIQLQSAPGLFDLLSAAGVELRVWRGVRYPNGQIEDVPLGVFVVDENEVTYTPAGNIAITAPDRWVKVQKARYQLPFAAIPGNSVTNEIKRQIALGFYPSWPGWGREDIPSHDPAVGNLIGERDKDKELLKMATSIGCELYFDNEGLGVIANMPTGAEVPVWLVDASASGILLGGNRKISRQKTYNSIVVASSATGVTVNPQIASDEDPTSPTYILGPMGIVTYFFTSPLILSDAQALATGQSILVQKRGLASQLTVESLVNPALDAGDVIQVLLPPETRGGERPVENHIVDSVTIPLVNTNSQNILTRSSRPDDDAEEG